MQPYPGPPEAKPVRATSATCAPQASLGDAWVTQAPRFGREYPPQHRAPRSRDGGLPVARVSGEAGDGDEGARPPSAGGAAARAAAVTLAAMSSEDPFRGSGLGGDQAGGLGDAGGDGVSPGRRHGVTVSRYNKNIHGKIAGCASVLGSSARGAPEGTPVKITTLRTTSDCPDIVKGPSVDLVDLHPDRVYMIGKVETDPAIVAAFDQRIGPGEALYWQPAELHLELRP